MWRRITLVIALLGACAVAQTVAPIRGNCALGKTQVSTQGLLSSNYVLGSFPGCRVTVYAHGGMTLSTIYSDSSLTALANPFCATTASNPAASGRGDWLFYAATGTPARYDIVMDQGTPCTSTFPTPFTIADVQLGSASGGGGDTITSPNATLNVGGTSTATTLDVAGAAGKIMAGSTPALTSTPSLGAPGTLGSITFGNATSGTVTIEPVTGALSTKTMLIPAANDVFVGRNTTDTLTNKSISGAEINSGTVLATYLPTATNSAPGILQPDDTTCTITTGILSCPGGVTSIQFKNAGTNFGSPLTGAGSLNFATGCVVSGTTPNFTITCSGSGGANTALSNLSAVAVNASVSPGAVGTGINLGTALLPWGNVFIGTTTSESLSFNVSSLTTNRTWTAPDASGTVTLLGNASTGSGNVVLQTSPTLITPALGVATATSLLATGIVDGKAPVTLTTSATASLGGTYKSGYTYNQEATAATAITYTLPTAAAGLQYCIANSQSSGTPDTGTLKLATSTSGQFIEFTDGTLTNSGGYVISGGSAADAACVVGENATIWKLYTPSGTWTKH